MAPIEDEANGLEKKAEVIRSIHVFCAQKCKLWIDFSLIMTIILTLLIALVSLIVPLLFVLDSKWGNILAALIAIASLAVLIFSISDRIFGLNERYAGHIQGVKLLTDFIRDCHQFRHVDLIKNEEKVNLARLDTLKREYSHLNHILPMANTSDKDFLKCKQNLLLKIEVSKKLKDDPHLNIDDALKTHTSENSSKLK